MIQKCEDVFSFYELPFETYFSKCIEHDNEVHEEMELIWLIRGQATIICEGREFILTSQNIFMIYMYRVHSIKTTEGSIMISYRFKKEHLTKNNLFFERIPFMQRVYTFQELVNKYHEVPLLIAQLLKLLISDNPSPLIRYKIIGYYNMFIYELYNMLLKEKYLDIKKINYDEYLIRIHSIIEYTHNHYSEKISLDKLSEITGISTFRVSHFVKDVLGISYRDFLQNSRFENAIKRIRQTDDAIADIAKDCGFSDQKYLNQMMKKRFDMTTLKYRMIWRSTDDSEHATFNATDFIEELRLCLDRMEIDNNLQDTFGLSKN